MARVLVVEDDPTMREMVAYNLRRQGLDVVVASDGGAGLAAAHDPETALMVVDLMLPGRPGLEVVEEAHRRRPALPVLILTARGEEEMKLRGFAAGADDYLTKPFSMEELVARVKALLRRARVDDIRSDARDELHFGDLRLSPRDFRCWVDGNEVALRPKEFSLLAALASEPGRLFTRVELAERVWGYSHLGTTRTIDTHVKNIRRRVEDRSRYRYIESVRGVGYRFRVDPKAST